jgi:hypothetical protein
MSDRTVPESVEFEWLKNLPRASFGDRAFREGFNREPVDLETLAKENTTESAIKANLDGIEIKSMYVGEDLALIYHHGQKDFIKIKKTQPFAFFEYATGFDCIDGDTLVNELMSCDKFYARLIENGLIDSMVGKDSFGKSWDEEDWTVEKADLFLKRLVAEADFSSMSEKTGVFDLDNVVTYKDKTNG